FICRPFAQSFLPTTILAHCDAVRGGRQPPHLAAYNAGPGRYEDFRDRHRPLPPETLAYVAGLLPLLGQNGDTIPLLAVHPDPLAWRRAPIFIALANDASANITARDLSPIAPHSAGLFVTVSDREPAP
ncbi:lytic transglycosylase domain-containing protein, partial [Acetobacter lovaniensis]